MNAPGFQAVLWHGGAKALQAGRSVQTRGPKWMPTAAHEEHLIAWVKNDCPRMKQPLKMTSSYGEK